MTAHQILFAAVFLALLSATTVVARSTRRRGDERCARQLDHFLWTAGYYQHEIVDVVEVYKRAHRGSKVVLTSRANGVARDAWLWWYWPTGGDVLAVRTDEGWGPHNQHPILYVGEGDNRCCVPRCDVFGAIDSKTQHRALRHYRRWRVLTPALNA